VKSRQGRDLGPVYLALIRRDRENAGSVGGDAVASGALGFWRQRRRLGKDGGRLCGVGRKGANWTAPRTPRIVGHLQRAEAYGHGSRDLHHGSARLNNTCSGLTHPIQTNFLFEI
jgi:hypothetical protein